MGEGKQASKPSSSRREPWSIKHNLEHALRELGFWMPTLVSYGGKPMNGPGAQRHPPPRQPARGGPGSWRKEPRGGGEGKNEEVTCAEALRERASFPLKM